MLHLTLTNGRPGQTFACGMIEATTELRHKRDTRCEHDILQRPEDLESIGACAGPTQGPLGCDMLKQSVGAWSKRGDTSVERETVRA